jgi:hypothetical protein
MSARGICRALVVSAGACAALSFAVVPAGAATHGAPLCGALNMIEASPSYYGTNAVSDGMDIAMTRDNNAGNLGMFGAVAASSAAC